MKNLFTLMIGILAFQISFSHSAFLTIETNNVESSYMKNNGFVRNYPTAATDSAVIVSSDSTMLYGTVNTYGFNVIVTFEWGLTSNYGNIDTAFESPVSGSGTFIVSCKIPSTNPSTIYFYKVVAYYNSSSASGSDMSFTTPSIAPYANTDTFSSVTVMSAVLNATVNANNDFTYAWFEWGTTATYGNIIYVDQNPITGSSNTSVTATITNLEAYTNYHFRIVASNTANTVTGNDITFKTTGLPPEVTTLSATSIDGYNSILNADVITNDEVEITYDADDSNEVYFEWGTDQTYGQRIYADQNPLIGPVDTFITAGIENLIPNSTYHFRAVAINKIDTTFGSDESFTTPGVPPSATTDSAIDVSTDQATLQGSVNANNENTVVTFQWGLTTAYDQSETVINSPINGISVEQTSVQILQLLSNTTYHFRVVAENATDITYGNDMTFTTIMVPPFVVTDTATSVSDQSAIVASSVNPNNVSCIVSFDWGTSQVYANTAIAVQDTLTGSADTNIQLPITGLDPNTVYNYRAKAIYGNDTSYGVNLDFKTIAIAAEALTDFATGVTMNSAVLHADVNANNDSTYVSFEWGTNTSYGNVVMASLSPLTGMFYNAETYTLINLLPNTTYHYRVVATNSAGTTHGADEYFTTPAFDMSTLITLTTKDVVPTSKTTAISGGDFDQISTYPILQKGICWSLKPEPDTSSALKTSEGTGYGSFSSVLTGLNSRLTYFVRSYAITEMGILYGNEVALSSIRSTGVEENVNDFVKIYSFNKKACVKIKDYTDNTTGTIEIYNTTGKRITSSTLNTDLNVIDMSMATRGYYIVRVNQNNLVSTQKIYIE
jgi:phosphodiesterase/alkaline phosphatase D-like protein